MNSSEKEVLWDFWRLCDKIYEKVLFMYLLFPRLLDCFYIGPVEVLPESLDFSPSYTKNPMIPVIWWLWLYSDGKDHVVSTSYRVQNDKLQGYVGM